MSMIITAEHILLTQEAKQEIEAALEKLYKVLPDSAQIRLNIKPQSKGDCQATLTVHSAHKDFVYTERGSQLLPLVKSVKAHLMRELVALKEKRVDARRRARSGWAQASSM